MEGIDLRALSNEDFNVLKWAVMNEARLRKVVYKSSSLVSSKLHDLLEDRLINDGCDDYGTSKALEELEKSIYKIVDITSGNYKVTQKGKGKHMCVICNNSIALKDPKNYTDMCDEILDVMKKHIDN